MIRIKGESILGVMQECRQNKVPYLSISSGLSNKVVSEGIEYTSNDPSFPPNELYFIKMVKNSILENNPNKKKILSGVSKSDIKYFDYSRMVKPGLKLMDCVEVDLNSAYWESAYKLGIIPEYIYKRALDGMSWEDAFFSKKISTRTYDRCAHLTIREAYDSGMISKKVFMIMSPISKVTRLAAIGSLAKTTRITCYSGHRVHLILRKKDDLHYLWDAICYNIYQLIKRAIKEIGEDNFIFFWVDAIVVKKSCQNKLTDFFNKEGYPFKKIKVNKVTVSKNRIKIHSNKKSKSGSDVREFNLNTKRRKNGK